AIVHALTTLSAGGFSPHPESIAGYRSPAIEWILCIFMLLSGTSFTLQYKVFTGRPLVILKDGEFAFYSPVIVVVTALLAVALAKGLPGFSEVRTSLFQVTSLISGTGFASTDYILWSDSARALLIVVMIIGGCAASASGG